MLFSLLEGVAVFVIFGSISMVRAWCAQSPMPTPLAIYVAQVLTAIILAFGIVVVSFDKGLLSRLLVWPPPEGRW